MHFLETCKNIWKICLHVIAVEYTSGGILPIFLSSYWYHAPNIFFFYNFATIVEAAILPRPNYSFSSKIGILQQMYQSNYEKFSRREPVYCIAQKDIASYWYPHIADCCDRLLDRCLPWQITFCVSDKGSMRIVDHRFQ